MFVFFDPLLVERIGRWPQLKRWERRELGQDLRRLGMSYAEIRQLIPVPKGTLSGWCRDIALNEGQLARIASIQPRVRLVDGINVLRRRRLERTQAIRELGRREGSKLLADPMWVMGTSLYWAEGSKRTNEVAFSNSDPDMVRFFIAWACRYLGLTLDRFTARMHLHAGQDEAERMEFWSSVTGLARSQFRSTFIKPEGSGHRKNVLYNGTLQLRVTCSVDLLHRLLGWIDVLRDALLSSE